MLALFPGSAIGGQRTTNLRRHSGALNRARRNASDEFRAWWPRHEIAPLSSGTKRLRHPSIGELELHHVVLQIADDPEQKLVTFAASDTDQARIDELLAAPPR